MFLSVHTLAGASRSQTLSSLDMIFLLVSCQLGEAEVALHAHTQLWGTRYASWIFPILRLFPTIQGVDENDGFARLDNAWSKF